MTVGEFLQNNGLVIETQAYYNPYRLYAKLIKPPLIITMTVDKMRTEVIGIGATYEEAVASLFDNCAGKPIRIKGWDENDNYIDTKIKVPKDINLQGAFE